MSTQGSGCHRRVSVCDSSHSCLTTLWLIEEYFYDFFVKCHSSIRKPKQGILVYLGQTPLSPKYRPHGIFWSKKHWIIISIIDHTIRMFYAFFWNITLWYSWSLDIFSRIEMGIATEIHISMLMKRRRNGLLLRGIHFEKDTRTFPLSQIYWKVERNNFIFLSSLNLPLPSSSATSIVL